MGSSGVGTSNPQNLHNVFVYGSLLADDVVQILLKRVPPSSPANLHGFHRFSIKGRVYPAILPVESKKVTGKVLLGITAPELDILDTFEDVEYERSTVEVSLVESCEKLQAQTYVWGNKNDPTLYGDWDFECRTSTRSGLITGLHYTWPNHLSQFSLILCAIGVTSNF